MSNQKVAADFDQLIQADRQRRKNEDLAKEVFGRTRKNDIATRRENKRIPKAPSLASRIGITKRSSSTSSLNNARNPPSRPSSAAAQDARQNRLAKEITGGHSANIVMPKSTGSGFSIKGSAAPFVVEARNFEIGTTDADISSAIGQDTVDSNGISALVSCKIVATTPVVVAELVFNERSIAEAIIKKYHKQRADGQTLELRLARSGPGSMSKSQQKLQTPQPALPIPDGSLTTDDDNVMVDVEAEPVQPSAAAYNTEREEAEQNRRDRDSRRDREDYNGSSRRRDDDRRREGRVRDENRDRERDHERDIDRDERDERPQYQREDAAGGRLSHYGNGVSTNPRPSYGNSYAGGRGQYPGYGGYGGRGSYRGGYRGYR